MVSERGELETIRDFYEYNFYVRKKYLRAIFEKIPEEERYKDRGASFPSIVDIFVHVIDAYRFWFVHVYQGTTGGYQELKGQRRFTLEELQEENEKIFSHLTFLFLLRMLIEILPF